MNDGKVIIQIHRPCASSNVRFIKLPSVIAKPLRKSLQAIGEVLNAFPRLASTAKPYISGGTSLVLKNSWAIIITVELYFWIQSKRRKAALTNVTGQVALSEPDLAALQQLQPSQVAQLLEVEKLDCLVDGLDRLLLERIDTAATELVALPFFSPDLKIARQLYATKRDVLSHICTEEGFEQLLQKKWERFAAWRQQLATTSAAVDIGLQRASLVQELEWKDFSNWQKRLQVVDPDSEEPLDSRAVRSSDPVYHTYTKWEKVIG